MANQLLTTDPNVKRVLRCASTGGEEGATAATVISVMWAVKTPSVLNANQQQGHQKLAATALPVASSPGAAVGSSTRPGTRTGTRPGTRTGLHRAPGSRTGLQRVANPTGLEVAKAGANRMEGQDADMEPTATEL